MSTRNAQTRRPISVAWRKLGLASPPFFFLAIALFSLFALTWPDDETRSLARQDMHEIAREMTSQIEWIGRAGLARTVALATDPALPRAVAAGSRAGAEVLANELLQQAPELDIIAIFDNAGKLLAVNTVNRNGEPVSPERIARLYAKDFTSRAIVRDCIEGGRDKPRLEFQTHCDFTPTYFDSSGLSVAFSAPFRDATGAQAGVVSSRLDFRRLSSVLDRDAFALAGNKVFLVSQRGEFFDEEINQGLKRPPIDTRMIRSAIAAPNTSLAFGDRELVARPVELPDMITHGGLDVILAATSHWLDGPARHTRRTCGVALLGSLTAMSFWILFLAARVRRLRAVQDLAAERARTKLILDTAGEGVIATDAGGVITFANTAACNVLRSSPGAVLGRRWSELAPHAPPACAIAETDLRRPDGSIMPARVTRAHMPGRDGEVLTFVDLTAARELNEKLLKVNRQAGMAEVASGVLHNVGNVLNSVNVSADVATSRLCSLRIDGLARAAALLKANTSDLPAFFATPQGRTLPDYLAELSRCAAADQREAIRELASLRSNLEHIKEIVAAQQTSASPTGTRELQPVDSIVEDAIRICSTAFSRHVITLERAYEPAPHVLVERFQVLQILINLLTNAKHALSETSGRDRTIRIRIRADGPGVLVQIADNGVGIPPDNLTRIFAHGFTTRKDGHGFGLHSAALAAKAMGGRLRAESNGPGRGAIFTLELPTQPALPVGGADPSLPALHSDVRGN